MKLLQLAGCDIVIPKTQSCCGALHGHAGEKNGAKELAKRNIKSIRRFKHRLYYYECWWLRSLPRRLRLPVKR